MRASQKNFERGCKWVISPNFLKIYSTVLPDRRKWPVHCRCSRWQTLCQALIDLYAEDFSPIHQYCGQITKKNRRRCDSAGRPWHCGVLFYSEFLD
jgi:hypothetical protein